jgi:phosphohistidine phosphatase
MKLYLVQHGEACAKQVDPERPLTEQGNADVDRLAAFLKQAGIRVERVIHSGKLRAVQTAEYLAQAIAPGVVPESSGIINPNDDPRAFDWQSDSWDHDTLVVGHLPFMARLVSHLVVEDEDKPLGRSTGCSGRSCSGKGRTCEVIQIEHPPYRLPGD